MQNRGAKRDRRDALAATRARPIGQEGRTLRRADVQRLRRLGFLLVVGAPVVELVNWALRLSLSNTLPNPLTVTPGFSFPFALLLAGLGAFVLAEVFAHGTRLREDVEATI